MSSKGKYIGVESRVQYEVLEAAIHDYLANGYLDKEKCLNHIKQFTKGENRAGKILKHISVLLSKNATLLAKLRKKIKAGEFAQLHLSDRKAISLCLYCNSFPIAYDILLGFSQAFKVQDIVSKEVIVQKIGAIYGSNRSMHIAITEIIPLLIECDMISRNKIGLYAILKKLHIRNILVSELIIYTDINLSGSKSILIDELKYKPWYAYFDLSDSMIDRFNVLISKKDSVVGRGYLMII